MSRIDRIRRAAQARSASRTEAEPVELPGETVTPGLPVPVGPVATLRTFRDEPQRGDSQFAAHVIGQDGQRRGLRAGPQIVNVARDAYNRVEWSGSYDRRARKGALGRTDV